MTPVVVVERPPAAATEIERTPEAESPAQAGAPLAGEAELAALAEAGRWEELIGAASDRLARLADDQAALYWNGRAHLERGQQLRTGGRFARDLAGSMLRRAAELLGGVRAEGAFADAPEWALFARYLAGDDATLAADLERAAGPGATAPGSGYAARLRGQLARDLGEDGAASWFERAAELLPDEAGVRIDLAMARAGRGDRAGALVALEDARALGADRDAWLATLLAVLPTTDDARELLARLQPLLAEPGAERDATLAWYRAFGLQELGRFDEALAVLAAATDNRQPGVERTQAALLLRLGRPLESAAVVRPLATAGDADALEQLVTAADALAQSFRWQESLALYDEALAIEPAHGRARSNRALTQARAGGPLDGYDALVAAHPERADILNDAALCWQGRGERETARALFRRAAALPPDVAGSQDARENLAALLLSDRPPDAAGALTLLAAVLDTEPARDRSLVLRAQAKAALNASAGRR